MSFFKKPHVQRASPFSESRRKLKGEKLRLGLARGAGYESSECTFHARLERQPGDSDTTEITSLSIQK